MNAVPYTPTRTRNIQMADPVSRVRKTDPGENLNSCSISNSIKTVVTIGVASKSDLNRRTSRVFKRKRPVKH